MSEITETTTVIKPTQPTAGFFDENTTYEIGIPTHDSLPTYYRWQKGKAITVQGKVLSQQYKIKTLDQFFQKNPLRNTFNIFDKYATPNNTWYIIKIADDGEKRFVGQGTFLPEKPKPMMQRPVSRRVQPTDSNVLADGDYRDEIGRFSQTPNTSYNALINEKQAIIDDLKRRIEQLQNEKGGLEEMYNQRYIQLEARITSAEKSAEHYRQIYESASEKITNAEIAKSEALAKMDVLEERHKYEIQTLKAQHDQEIKNLEKEMQEASQQVLSDELEKHNTPLNQLADIAVGFLSQPAIQNAIGNFIGNKIAQFAPPHPGGVSPSKLAQAQMVSSREDLLQALKEGRLSESQFKSLSVDDQQWLQQQFQILQQQQQQPMAMSNGQDEFAEAMS